MDSYALCRRNSGDEGGEMKDVIMKVLVIVSVPFLLVFYLPALLGFTRWSFSFFGLPL